MKDVDFVVTYVDQSDIYWQRGYEEACFKNRRLPSYESPRFRSWGTIKYALRGVGNFMPWINNVYLVVERDTQVPQWVNRSEVNIIYHHQIIPMEYLPTYNSCTIEMFLWKIPDLAEKFIYANDDMIPVDVLTENEFYDGNTPRLSYKPKEYDSDSNMYCHQLHSTENLVRDILGMPEDNEYVMKTGHNLNPMLKSTWAFLFKEKEAVILDSLSAFRQKKNLNQDLSTYWHILSGDFAENERRTKYTEMEYVFKLIDIIENSDAQLICINDNKASHDKDLKQKMINSFERRLPHKSKYEL